MRFDKLLLLGILAAPSTVWGSDFFFVQMSDPQFGMYTADGEFSQETANFEFAIANANRLRPAFVVVCGDLVNKPGDSAQTAEYLRIVAKLNPAIKLYSVAGNHDVRNEPTSESLAAYRQKFGPDYYVFRYQDFAGFVIDSSLIQHPDKALAEAARQEQWLATELEKVKRDGAQRIAVFQHIPWFLENPDEADQYFNLPREARQKYLPLFRRYGVAYAFAGHFHRNAYADGPDWHIITTGPVGKPLGIDPSGIRVVIVKDSTMESQYYGLGNIPNQVELKAHSR
jgi:3',5'-cyclic AMP phosphodiesterase CpdA